MGVFSILANTNRIILPSTMPWGNKIGHNDYSYETSNAYGHQGFRIIDVQNENRVVKHSKPLFFNRDGGTKGRSRSAEIQWPVCRGTIINACFHHRAVVGVPVVYQYTIPSPPLPRFFPPHNVYVFLIKHSNVQESVG